jgi:uncharacterized protein YndB with AHSA1/START domain
MRSMTVNDIEFVIEPGRQDLTLRCLFAAPRKAVFRAITDPELIPRWWGRREHGTRVDRMDVRPGGIWRFVEEDTDGHQYAFRGVYHSVAPERTVLTFEYEGAPGHVALQTLALEEVVGGTRYQATSVFQSTEDRDAMVVAGMEVGARESMDQLAELVRELD